MYFLINFCQGSYIPLYNELTSTNRANVCHNSTFPWFSDYQLYILKFKLCNENKFCGALAIDGTIHATQGLFLAKQIVSCVAGLRFSTLSNKHHSVHDYAYTLIGILKYEILKLNGKWISICQRFFNQARASLFGAHLVSWNCFCADVCMCVCVRPKAINN